MHASSLKFRKFHFHAYHVTYHIYYVMTMFHIVWYMGGDYFYFETMLDTFYRVIIISGDILIILCFFLVLNVKVLLLV